nr:hypothetical protein [Deinococcus detaillensis]
MATLTVVEHFNPFKYQAPRVSAVSLRFLEIQFQLEGRKEALYCGVIPALPLPAHTLQRLQALQSLSILATGVLGEFK